MLSHWRLALWPWLFCLARTGLVNITIDDSSPDPRTGISIEYEPPTAWNTRTLCQNGPGKCSVLPDAGNVFGGTWHESTFNPSIDTPSNGFPNTVLTASIEFDGTAVYVYGVLALSTVAPTGKSDMSFILNGQVVGSFLLPAPGHSGYTYNTLLYSNSALLPGHHKLAISNGRVGAGKSESLIILDRIVYSFEDSGSPATANPATISNNPTSNPTIQITSTTLTTGIAPMGSSSVGLATSSNPLLSSPNLNSSMLNSSTLPTSLTNLTSSGHEVLPTNSNLLANPSAPSNPSSTNPPSPKSSMPSLGVILGAILAPLLTMLLVGIIILLICRRRRKRVHAAALRFSRAYQIPQSNFHNHDSSYYTPTPIDQFSSVQLPSPAYDRRPVTFGSTYSPAYSPTSPATSDPLRAVGYFDAPVNRGLTAQGWVVASDSKQNLLEARGAIPPAYHD